MGHKDDVLMDDRKRSGNVMANINSSAQNSR